MALSQSEMTNRFVTPFLSLCVHEPGKDDDKDGVESTFELSRYVQAYYAHACTYLLRTTYVEVLSQQWVFPVQRMSIYGVAKEVFEIKS